MLTYVHSGQIGDLLAFCAIAKNEGPSNLVVVDHPDHLQMSGWKYPSVEPLLKNQRYFASVSFGKYPVRGEGVVDTTNFRRFHGDSGGSVVSIQAKNLSLDTPPLTRWLEAPANRAFKNRVVACRSPRYRNYNFPWRTIARRAGDRLVFIGVDEEYADFQREVGRPVERYVARDLLEVASAIEGSDLFIGNQSSPFWIAAGLNHPLIQETSPAIPDSIIPFPGAYYCVDGFVDFDVVGL